ncbi:cobalt-precorrin-6A reductase [Streptomyces fuscigenes]|uniref:cobalt-precorrin-6A reductase n=1 Tax=Streptomyces fuscigenes TaxID=1528880 RepID=UPI001F3984ED|nr:cobalt-precorrin-6A reductase [Streptomyces fuscigenes]MCF3964694.1 cobalt-precorrin-6A reductase [Streptomyces fuscigenes]
MRHVLILGGTTEGRSLAEALLSGAPPGTSERPEGDVVYPLQVTSSLAGRVAQPVLPAGEVRVGGFGGADGLASWLREHHVDALIDATHPFAETMTANAALAAATCHVPLLRLRRPGWGPVPGDDWRPVASLAAAAEALAAGPWRRVFLSTGRTGLAVFAPLDGIRFLVRSVDPPEPPFPRQLDTVLDRGPFTLDGERELLRLYGIDVVVSKDSGGAATAPKLAAAREAGIPVVMVRRPAAPEGVETAASVAGALDWLRRTLTG